MNLDQAEKIWRKLWYQLHAQKAFERGNEIEVSGSPQDVQSTQSGKNKIYLQQLSAKYYQSAKEIDHGY